jgi:hypothetical protein
MFKFNKSVSTPPVQNDIVITNDNKLIFSKDKVVDITLNTIPNSVPNKYVERVEKKQEIFNSTDQLDTQIESVVKQINQAFLATKHINYNHRFISATNFINTGNVKSAIKVLASTYVLGPHVNNRFSVPAMLRRIAIISQLYRVR